MKLLSALGFALSACLAARNRNAPMAESREPRAQSRTIRISNFAFTPTVLTVSRGDTVAWVNQDTFIHTTAADSAAWSSPEIAKGDRFIFIASQAGRFSYHCAAHPVMRGEIVVQ